MDQEPEILSEPVRLAYDRYAKLKFNQNPLVDNMRILVPFYEETAAGYYRLLIPLFEVKRQGFARAFFRDEISKTDYGVEFEKALQWASSINIGRAGDMEIVDVSLELQKYGRKLITDQDDYPEAIGDTQYTIAKRNWTPEQMNVNQKLIRESDLLTVTVPYLKDIYSKMRRKPIAVLPNQIDALNPRWNFARKDNGEKVVIGWMAGPSHISDSEMTYEIISRVLKERENVVFKSVGFIDDWMMDFPRDRVILKPGKFGMKLYPQYMADMDIGIAPLADNDFNKGKSDLKYLEYAMAGTLPVVQAIGPYLHLPKSVTIHCDDIDNWVETLINLVDDKYLRRQEFLKAMKYTVHERTVYTNAHKWYKAFREIY